MHFGCAHCSHSSVQHEDNASLVTIPRKLLTDFLHEAHVLAMVSAIRGQSCGIAAVACRSCDGESAARGAAGDKSLDQIMILLPC